MGDQQTRTASVVSKHSDAMSQPTLKQLFCQASGNKKALNTATVTQPNVSEPERQAGAKAAVDSSLTLQQQHHGASLKENTPAAATDGAAASRWQNRDVLPQHKRLQPVPSQTQTMQAKHHTSSSSGGSKAKQQQQQPPSRSTQMYLDLGQRDFSASRCSVCGMMYAKGHEEDEKLHKAYHTGALQGFRFKGWAQERVLVSEVAQGRLLMVLQTDPTNQVKKVRELCAYVEKAHGITPGWLLSEPQARVFLYVSAQQRIVGLAVVEPLKQAYRVAAPAGSQEQEVDSTHGSQQQQQRRLQQQQQQQQSAQADSSILSTPASHSQQQQQQQQQEEELLHPPQKRQQQQQLLWPGLRKRGRLAALGRTVGSGGAVLLSDPSLHSDPGSSGVNMKADSCPTSLLAAAGRLQMQSSGGAGGSGRRAGTAAAAAAAAAREDHTTSADAVGADAAGAGTVQEDSMCVDQQQQQQQEMRPPQPVPEQQQQQPLLPWQRGAGAAAGAHSLAASAPSASTVAGGVGGGGGGGFSGAGTSSSLRRTGSVVGGAGAAAAGSGGGGGGARSLLVDQRRPVRALVGVRMVWVSPEQRRKGVATKLLDAARCNLVPCYVVPCNQVAFSQPTGDGVALAAAFAGTQQFLVYGLD